MEKDCARAVTSAMKRLRKLNSHFFRKLRGLFTFDLPTAKSIKFARISPNSRQIRPSILLKFGKILAKFLLFSLRQITCKQALIRVIKFYQQLMSPFLGNCCRFYPSCSAYAVDAISRYGCCYGIWLAVRRLLKCHPGGLSGFDPVP